MPKLALLILAAALAAAHPQVASAQPSYDTCGNARGESLKPGTGRNLVVQGKCRVAAGTTYKYANVNVVAGGELTFDDGETHFWTSGMIIENGGAVIAGDPGNPPTVPAKPIGTLGTLTIHLWGADQGTTPGGRAVPCMSDTLAALKAGLPAPTEDHCGIPNDVWTNGETQKVNVNSQATDYFYEYEPLAYDGQGAPIGYFGYKSIGVSYGGTLKLFGKKGASYPDVPASDSGASWRRLEGTVGPNNPGRTQSFVVDRKVDWKKGDWVVVTTTDYLPSHSEEMQIAADSADGRTFTTTKPFAYRHQGVKYPLPADGSLDRLLLKANQTSVETRAAVALLTRSIVVVSAGDTIDFLNPDLAPGSYFGGHTVVRAGFKTVQIQGVEFRRLGQGGRIGHYPVHFHMARTVPNATTVPGGTFVKDSSVNESMTRWYVLHATNGVLFARNVGWKSIGHGFYIEEGSEVDNKFQSNIGIYARPAIQNAVVNPRNVPGIHAAPFDTTYAAENVPFYSDVDHPTVFWIMNGWNDFEYNMAAGAGACGACYWLVPGANSGHSMHAKLTGYSSMQQTMDNNALLKAGTTPLRKFVGNFCTTAMTSFNTVGNQTACYGIQTEDPKVLAVPNPVAPAWCDQTNPIPPADKDCNDPANAAVCRACNIPQHAKADMYYPKVDKGGGRFGTICPSDSQDCSTTPRCDSSTLDSCMVTVIDQYTSSFHWNEHNFGAVWLRPQWYLWANSVLTDVQNGGLSFITGGGYTKSDLVQGHWALARKSLFIGNTQPATPAGVKDYASNAGPFNPKGIPATGTNCSGNHCLSADDGVSFPLSNFAMNQRLFNIYDGPAYQESNAYLDVTRTPVTDCTAAGQNCQSSSQWLSGRILGMPWDKTLQRCYLPNAAIAWKQSNGFYYPPAFHSANLYFGNVEIRHFVLSPLFVEGTYVTDFTRAQQNYCNTASNMFTNWSDVDRQTELSDDDGSLTGYVKTVSINVDPFFKAPVETIECASDESAKASPYDYVTTVVYPEAGFTDWLPAGVKQTGIVTNTCGALISADRIRMLPYSVIAPGGCTITVTITSSTPGTVTNTTSMLQTDAGNAPAVSATLTVSGAPPRSPAPAPAPKVAAAALIPPTLAMTIVPATIAPGGTATLTLTFGNANATPAMLLPTQWSKPCSDEHCFGVPMYRQGLLKGENTTGPIRLAGQSTFNRSTLTPNNGIFYIDTTASKTKQDAWAPPSNVNVFQPSTSYYLFLLFAKATTQQTYQVYVGSPFDPNTDVWATRADIQKDPVTFSPPNYVAWPSGWGRSYDAATGVLTVTMNMSFPEFATAYKGAFKENCQPSSFCTWTEGKTGGACGCNPTGPFASLCADKNKAGEDVCAWSQKDVDCPTGGCYGIGFKTGATFVYDPPVSPRPGQACLPKNAAWNVPFVPAPGGIAQSCPNTAKDPVLINFCGN